MNHATLLFLAQANPNDEAKWADLMFGFDSDYRFALIVIILGCALLAVLALAGIFAGITTSIHRRTAETQLKRDMLDRGMSAEEIATVIEATPPTDFLERWAKRKR